MCPTVIYCYWYWMKILSISKLKWQNLPISKWKPMIDIDNFDVIRKYKSKPTFIAWHWSHFQQVWYMRWLDTSPHAEMYPFNADTFPYFGLRRSWPSIPIREAIRGWPVLLYHLSWFIITILYSKIHFRASIVHHQQMENFNCSFLQQNANALMLLEVLYMY